MIKIFLRVILIFRVAEVTFSYIFDDKMLIVANIFKDFHHHHQETVKFSDYFFCSNIHFLAYL